MHYQLKNTGPDFVVTQEDIRNANYRLRRLRLRNLHTPLPALDHQHNAPYPQPGRLLARSLSECHNLGAHRRWDPDARLHRGVHCRFNVFILE